MPVVRLRYSETPPDAFRRGVISVGNFDGVHRGHAALLAAARALAGAAPVVPVTFDPHPLALLAPERFQPPLTTVDERVRLLHRAGADRVVVLATTPELLALSPEYFFETIIAGSLGAVGMVEGFNFRFGHDRAGSNDLLRTLCRDAGIGFREVEAFKTDGTPVSSSRVRDAISSGDIARATALLDHDYRITGTVVAGAKRGRTIGFPTANLDGVTTLLPADGVYAVRCEVDGRSAAGMANIGPNPTFGEQARKIEVHLLDFNGDLYGRSLAVDFVVRLRATQRFADVDSLIRQLRQDAADARRITTIPSPGQR